MQEQDHRLNYPPNENGRPEPPPAPTGCDRSQPVAPGRARYGWWWKTWQVVKVVQARLRFVAILALIGLLIGYWDTLNGYYEKWTRPLSGHEEAAAGDVEYFCPMHPFIVREDRKEKCPICHMDLARRKKGTGSPAALAAGTVSRVQLTPYRVVLAGVGTSEVRYLPLSREITTFGSVEFNQTTEAHIAARQKGRIVKLYANYDGQMVEPGEKLAVLDVRYSSELMETLSELRRARQAGNAELEQMARKRLRLWDVGEEQIQEFLRTGKVGADLTITSPIHGHVIKKYQREGSLVDEGTPLYDLVNLDSVWMHAQVYEADQALLKAGQAVRATTLSLPDEVFRGTLDFIYPHLDEASRTLAVRFHIPNPGHRLRPGMYATVHVAVGPAGLAVLARPSAGAGAGESTADLLAHVAAAPTGPHPGMGLMPLLLAAGRQALLHRGLVPAVPDSAVIDTGNLKVVYRETAPGVFDGVAVELGPRLTLADSQAAFYPVLAGLDAGDRVATSGSFLLDAETRLNPAAGSVYYGGSGGKGGASSAVTVRPSTPKEEDVGEKKANTHSHNGK
jgi:Cu(I)/Ag(I) efflux system membrane fusion protein